MQICGLKILYNFYDSRTVKLSFLMKHLISTDILNDITGCLKLGVSWESWPQGALLTKVNCKVT